MGTISFDSILLIRLYLQLPQLWTLYKNEYVVSSFKANVANWLRKSPPSHGRIELQVGNRRNIVAYWNELIINKL